METRTLEIELLGLRQGLRDQLDLILIESPIQLQAYKLIKEDLRYCEFLLKTCRNKQKIIKFG